MFAQFTELLNPALNRGLPPSAASTDPSLNYYAKGLDIAAAAYVAELGWLANPVSTHMVAAEMMNQVRFIGVRPEWKINLQIHAFRVSTHWL